MKKRKPINHSQSFSTHERRFQFDRVLRAVKRGYSLTLTYRNKPLARIVPLQNEANLSPEDPIFRLHDLAELIGPLSDLEIDSLIYGR